jgi:hypothetical protein
METLKRCRICGISEDCRQMSPKQNRCVDCTRRYCRERYHSFHKSENRTPEQIEKRKRLRLERATTRDVELRSRLKIRYGLTIEAYNSILENQNHRCAICTCVTSTERPKRFFVVDHDHQTGHVRGILCNVCNLVLGQAGDSVRGLFRFLDYLQTHQTGKQPGIL